MTTMIELSLFATCTIVLATMPMVPRLIGWGFAIAIYAMVWTILDPAALLALRIVLFGTALWVGSLMIHDGGAAWQPRTVGSEPAAATRTSPPATLAPTQVLAWGNAPAGYEERQAITITSPWHWQDIWHELHRLQRPHPPAPDIDLAQQTILVLFAGQQAQPCRLQARRLLLTPPRLVVDIAVVPDADTGVHRPSLVLAVPIRCQEVVVHWLEQEAGCA